MFLFLNDDSDELHNSVGACEDWGSIQNASILLVLVVIVKVQLMSPQLHSTKTCVEILMHMSSFFLF